MKPEPICSHRCKKPKYLNVKAATPVNIAEQEAMFFASKNKISPVFRYEHEKVAAAMRTLFELDSSYIN